jgi:hypothetical protein
MMTLYALLFALLSLPASAWEPEVYNSACPEDGLGVTAIEPALPRLEDYAIFWIDADDTTVANAPAVTNYDDYSVDSSIDYDTTASTSPASQPLTDAAMHAVDFFSAVEPTVDFFITDDYTAAVTSPASNPHIDAPIDTTVDFSVDDEGWDFKLPATIDYSIEANAW